MALLSACGATPTATPPPPTKAPATATPMPKPTATPAPILGTCVTDDPWAKYVGDLSKAKQGGVFTMCYHSDMGALLSIYSTGGMQKYVDYLHSSGLVRLAPDGVTWVPDACEKFCVNKEGDEYTFYLRKDIVAHDGYKITAEDVVFTFEAYASPKTGSGGGRCNTNWIVGYDKVKAGTTDRLDGVTKVDDYTVKVKLSGVVPDFLFATPGIVIIPKNVLGNLPFDKWKDSEYNVKLPAPGTGPFKLTEWKKGQGLVFQRNDKFFRGKPYLDTILINVLPNIDATYMALQRGAAEWYDWVTKPVLVDMQKDPNLVCEPDPFRTVMIGSAPGLSFNQTQPYLRDIRVRQAAAYAINPAELGAATDGGAEPVEHMMPWNWEWSHSPNVKWSSRYTYNPEKAKALLKEAGYDTNRELIYLMDASVKPTPVTLLLFQQLEKVGIKIKITMIERAAHNEAMFGAGNETKWDVYERGTYGTTPAAALDEMSCGAALSFTKWCDKEWDAWKKTVPIDPAERAKFYQKADEYLFENLPFVLIPVRSKLFSYGYACYSKKVHMVTNQFGMAWPEKWWKE